MNKATAEAKRRKILRFMTNGYRHIFRSASDRLMDAGPGHIGVLQRLRNRADQRSRELIACCCPS